MRIIYEPRGRALEYAPLAVSLYRGCSHGCTYCFAPDSTKTPIEKFRQPYARKDALKLLARDCEDLVRAGDTREILMSFTTDPYQPLDEEHHLTRSAIQILIDFARPFSILTKGGRRSTPDFDLMATRPDLCRYGTTLTFDNPEDSREFEPDAALPHSRLAALIYAKKKGIRTWVSLEPVIYPEQTIRLIQMTLDLSHQGPGIVDEYRIGKINHIESDITDQEWVKFARDAKTLLDEYGCRYVFKKDLQPYLRTAAFLDTISRDLESDINSGMTREERGGIP